MVLNKYYYKITLPDGEAMYCSGIGTEGELLNLTAEEDEIKKYANTTFGTAFFIDDDGTMLTNRHVVSTDLDKDDVKQFYSTMLSAIRTVYENYKSALSQEYSELESQKQSAYYYSPFDGQYYLDESKLAEIKSKQEELVSEYEEVQSTLDDVNSVRDLSKIRVETISELGIAYDDSYVTSEDDFLEKNGCVVKRVSKDEKIDLAILQLKSKETPESSYVFAVGEEGSQPNGLLEKGKSLLELTPKNEPLSIDDALYMIGFNAGPILAQTKEGIKTQMTSGKVTQMPDGERLLYSIPTLQGSSGSPVLDEDGNLVAVNFAKLGTTDNFNFGIPLEQIEEFLDE